MRNKITRVRVLLPIQGLSQLDYAVPDDMTLAPGDFVRVPLGPRIVTGVVWDEGGANGKVVALDKLKPVAEKINLPPLPKATRRFVHWVSDYYLAAANGLLRMTMPVPGALENPPTKTYYHRGVAEGVKLTDKRQSVWDAIRDGEMLSAKELAERAGVSDAVVRAMAGTAALEAITASVDAPYLTPDPEHPGPKLSKEQQSAADELKSAVTAHEFKPILLEGVTGAGKTEVYFEAIAEALRDPSAQILVLIPEIGLTSQWLGRFEKRFGVRPVQWHSDLGQAERRRAWRSILKGEARVVVGARSALFLPFQDLSLIIVDEEHDPSYKQEDGLCYNARDMAVVRAHLGEIPVVLASATPSLETVQNALSERYAHVKLKSRHGGAALPDIHAVDMRQAKLPAGRWLSPELVKGVQQALEDKEQALLFLNRRGYAPLTLCRTCGERLECPNCSSWLVEHRLANKLMCHHCGYNQRLMNICPSCENENTLVACGPGVERLAEEVRIEFPDARILELTSDTLTSPSRAAAAVQAIDDGDVDIIVGTQLVTKGYHFPNLTLVGVVDADLGLAGGDLRAAERSFQQLTQVAGRAGRAQKPGRVYVQTHMPENPVMQALISGDQDAFIAREAEARKLHHMPPFGKLAALIVSATEERQALSHARALAKAIPQADGVQVLGPAPAPMAILRGRYRFRLLVKATRRINMQKYLSAWLKRVPKNNAIRLGLDIDPYSFM